jgi:hypothetical protein
MKFLLIDGKSLEENGADMGVTEFETLAEVSTELRERAADYTDTRESWRSSGASEREEWLEEVTVYEIVRKVPVNIETTVSVSVGEPSVIPPPLPGETVTDYATRITRG